MNTFLIKRKKIEKRKRYLFLGTSITSVLFFIKGSYFFGTLGMGFGIYLAYRWFLYRLKNGIKF